MVTVKVYGKTAEVNETNPNFNFHTNQNLPFINVEVLIGDEDGSRIWKETIKATNLEEAERQGQELITFFNDTIQKGEKRRGFFGFYQEDEEVAKYKDEEGVSGWLNPEGQFYPCGFGEHSRYAREVLEIMDIDVDSEDVANDGHIPMSCNEQSTLSHIGILGDITESQLEWFNRFFYKLSSSQKSDLKKAVEKQGLKLKYNW